MRLCKRYRVECKGSDIKLIKFYWQFDLKCFEIHHAQKYTSTHFNECVCIGDVYLSPLNYRVNIRIFTKEGKIGEEEVRYLLVGLYYFCMCLHVLGNKYTIDPWTGMNVMKSNVCPIDKYFIFEVLILLSINRYTPLYLNQTVFGF